MSYGRSGCLPSVYFGGIFDVGGAILRRLHGFPRGGLPDMRIPPEHRCAHVSHDIKHDAAAYLAVQLMANMNNSYLAGAYSYAIRTIFDKAALNYYVGTQSDVTNLISTAFTATQGGNNVPSVAVYTPYPNAAVAQELLVVQTPEASTLANLAFDLSALLGIVFVVRRRILRGRAMASATKV